MKLEMCFEFNLRNINSTLICWLVAAQLLHLAVSCIPDSPMPVEYYISTQMTGGFTEALFSLRRWSLRQLSWLLYISYTDWISPSRKAPHSSSHSCHRTRLEQRWHMCICLKEFLGFPDVCLHCAGPTKGQECQKANMSDVCPLVWGHLLPGFLLDLRSVLYLQYEIQAKCIPLKSCSIFMLLRPALTSLSHPLTVWTQ